MIRHRDAQSGLTKATLLLVSALTVLSSMTLSPVLPSIKRHFQGSENADLLTPFVLTLHALFIVIGSPLAGYAVDRFGRKQTLMLAALVYGLAGGGGFLLDGLVPLLVSRALLGLATAGTMTGATTLIADYYTGTTRTRLTSWQTAIMNIGGVVALVLSGFLAGISWHLPFLIFLFGVALVPLIAIAVVEPERREPGLASTVLPKEALPVKILLTLYAVMFGTMLLFFFVPAQLPFYLQSLGVGSVESGVALAAANLCTGLVAFFYSRFSRSLSRLQLIALGFGAMAVGLLLLGTSQIYLLMMAGSFLSGATAGIVLPTLGLWIMEITPLAVRGRALSGLTASIFMGQFVSPLVSQPLQRELGFGGVYLLGGAVALGLVLVFVLQRRSIPVVVQSGN